MALVSKPQNEMLATLQEKLDSYMANRWWVMIHICSAHMEMHHAFYPDDALVTDSELLLSFGHFKLSMQFDDSSQFNIEYNDVEDSYCIITDEMEIYLDFLHKE